MQIKGKVKRRKRIARKITSGKVFVHATFNNTIVTVSDPKGEVVCWSSPGVVGFKGSKKSTPFAASIAAKDAVKKAKIIGIKEVDVVVKGPGSGKESAARSIKTEGLIVRSITDITPTPHNGCRGRKKRRV